MHQRNEETDMAQRNAAALRFRKALRHAIAFVLLLILVLVHGTSSISMGAELTRCNAFNDAATTWAAVATGSDKPLPLRGLDPRVLLPDGSEFRTWEQPPDHRRTFFVAQQDADASDDNSGTEDRPWKTIGRAAAALEPGDRVIVKQGVYREWVRPVRSGLGPRRMITYQAAPGQTVVIRGSEQITGPWKASTYAGRPRNDLAWSVELPETLFDGYNPFAEPNVIDAESNPYWRAGKRKPPQYSLARGLVFQNGRRLLQKATYDALSDSPGTYWVESGGRRLHIRPFGDTGPQTAVWEVTTREFAFAPEKAGLGFIRIDGFTVDYVASCFPIPQRGAISTRQGHHWIIQNNTVCDVNSLGLDYGRRPTFVPFTVPEDTPKLAGVGHIIRRNSFSECGVCSMQGLGLFGGLVEDNISSGCGWQHVSSLAETGGIKLHYLKHVVVRRNRVYNTIDAPGLWVDHSNANTRVTQNVVIGADSPRWGGIFLEATYLPVMVDNNIVWGCNGHGFYQHDCSNLIVANNLFGECTKKPVYMRFNEKRVLDIETNRLSTCVHNRVHGSVFYGFGERGPDMPKAENTSDYNLFVNRAGEDSFDLAAWRQQSRREAHSMTLTATMDLSTVDGRLHQQPAIPDFLVPRLRTMTFDYFTTPRAGTQTQAGPFDEKNRKMEMKIQEGASP